MNRMNDCVYFRNTVRSLLPFHKHWYQFIISGDIIYISVLGQPIIILNSHAVSVELLEKRSSIYSDRPEFAMTKDMYVFTHRLSLLKGLNFQ